MQRKICAPLELKEADDSGKFAGYGSIFNNIDLGGDVILPGAFKKFKYTKNKKIRIPFYHDLQLIGGLADVKQDDKGLFVDGELDLELSYVTDEYRKMKTGALDGMSVGFDILPDGIKYIEGGDGVRGHYEISKAELWEVSIVPFGMNPKAKITSIKDVSEIREARDLEYLFKEIGFSKRRSIAMASACAKVLRSDSDNLSPLSDSVKGEIDDFMAKYSF